ncbi:conserved hypothetical protein (plasmid) [Escherichia coli 53638]|uniref:Putative membrane protein n=2 Tax=Shigella TaxID=620 RepID=I6DQN0_SHIBO|nr:conserved hypothetical protein [Escherichia coli 53638]EIQ17708.1 putative membrane protein [Shigella flexneri K-1770]EIQ34072.1 putative membrane protein [Shigella boydii 4444-74]
MCNNGVPPYMPLARHILVTFLLIPPSGLILTSGLSWHR